MSHLKAAAPAAKEGDRGRVSLAKVQRYWAGRVVGAVEQDDAEPGPASTALFASSRQEAQNVDRTPVAAAVIVKKADPRLARLAKTNIDEARGEGRQRHAYVPPRSCPIALRQ